MHSFHLAPVFQSVCHVYIHRLGETNAVRVCSMALPIYFLSGVALQVMASQTNLRRRNASVTLFNPIRCPYPCVLAHNFLTITQNRHTRSQSSMSADRCYSTRARKPGINHLRGVLYVDTDKIFGHLSRAGLDVQVSRLMKGEDLGMCYCYRSDILLT